MILFFSISFSTFGQIDTTKRIYRDYGVWTVELPYYNRVAVGSYITRNEISTFEQKSISAITFFKYRYEFYFVSYSVFNNFMRNTWLYGARIYINGFEETSRQFPNGFNVYITTQPTLVYWYETDYDNINISMTWVNSSIDNR
jgi:hypothetical protein